MQSVFSLWSGFYHSMAQVFHFIPSWAYLALVSAVFVTCRHITIKKYCASAPPEILVFTTRVIGGVVLLIFLPSRSLEISSHTVFWPVLAVTVFVTACATVFQTWAIQKHHLSLTVPYLSFIPIFMIPWTWLLLRQLPNGWAFVGMGITSLGAYLLNVKGDAGILEPMRGLLKSRGSLIMLGVAFSLGLTTTCDTIAIRSSSAYTYTLVWAWVSVGFMSLFSFRHGLSAVRRAFSSPAIYAQAVLWTGGFLLQMAAVGKALAIESGTAYVKALTMLNVVLTVGAGGHLFAERQLIRKAFASALMVLGAVLILYVRR